MTKLKLTRSSPNIFKDLGFDIPEAQNLAIRSHIMMTLREWYRASGLTPSAAAKALGVSKLRLSMLLKGKIDNFTVGALIDMTITVGFEVEIKIRKSRSLRINNKASANDPNEITAKHTL